VVQFRRSRLPEALGSHHEWKAQLKQLKATPTRQAGHNGKGEEEGRGAHRTAAILKVVHSSPLITASAGGQLLCSMRARYMYRSCMPSLMPSLPDASTSLIHPGTVSSAPRHADGNMLQENHSTAADLQLLPAGVHNKAHSYQHPPRVGPTFSHLFICSRAATLPAAHSRLPAPCRPLVAVSGHQAGRQTCCHQYAPY
jgi:hypothetical protein